jgi:hypothetical protein
MAQACSSPIATADTAVLENPFAAETMTGTFELRFAPVPNVDARPQQNRTPDVALDDEP